MLQYFPFLRQHGIEPVASRPVPEAVYQRLVEHGRRGSGAKAAFYSAVPSAARPRRAARRPVRRRGHPARPVSVWTALARTPARPPQCASLVYDTDDATYLRPAFTPDTPFQRLRRFDKVAEVVRRARWVSAATEPIAVWARRYNPNVSVVPMAVDLAEYDRARVIADQRRTQRPLVLGWAGTAGGLRYLDALAPVCATWRADTTIVVRVISGGYRACCLPGVHVDARPWRPETGLADMAGFDIGLVPLDDTPFEQAKFPFKLLQYLALGVPSVSARVGTAASLIHDGENGLLAGTADEWRSISKPSSPIERCAAQLAAAGRETVAAHYSIERVGAATGYEA